ncbi:acid protease [Trichoderma sp. SZMC 28013]
MLVSALKALPFVLAASVAAGPPTNNRVVQHPGILKPITASPGANLRAVNHRQLDNSLTNQLNGTFYSIDIEVGTPDQLVSLLFDTGSSELWVNPNCNKASNPSLCQQLGHFDSARSSAFNDTGIKPVIGYGSGYVNMTYDYEAVKIDSAKLRNQLFGVVFDGEPENCGIIGAGANLRGWDDPYPTFINTLAQQGFTNSRAYSLDLRSIETQRGSVIFGGIDTGKFSGHLEKRPIIPAEQSPDGATRFWIYLDGITVSTENGTEVAAFDKVDGQPVLLDSGATLSSLPGPIVNELLKGFPSAQARGPLYQVDCPLPGSIGAVNFKFGKVIIKVSLEDFILQVDESSCALGVQQNDEMSVLGDTFLRAAYVVYDWDNRNIHLANSVDCGSHLVAIGKGLDAVPLLTGDCPETAPTSTSIATSTSSVGYTNSTRLSSSSNTATPVPSNFTCLSTVASCIVGSISTERIVSRTTYCPVTITSNVLLTTPKFNSDSMSAIINNYPGTSLSETQISFTTAAGNSQNPEKMPTPYDPLRPVSQSRKVFRRSHQGPLISI